MKFYQRLSYSALNLPTSAAGMPIFIFILPFYADDLGLGLSLVGIIFFLGRFTDILTDPVIGLLTLQLCQSFLLPVSPHLPIGQGYFFGF